MSYSNKGISISKAEENKNKGVGSSYSAYDVKTNVGPSGGTSVTRKKYVTKMKSLTKRHVQVHEYHSEANEDCVI